MVITSNLFGLLKKIKNNPKVYLGKSSLFILDHFIGGYSGKEYEIEGWSRTSTLCLRKFQKFIEGIYNLPATTKGVCRIIAENTTNDEEAFYKFFELLEKYLEQAHPNLACEFSADERTDIYIPSVKISASGQAMTISTDLLKLLKVIKARPGMYLGGVSLKVLNHFINGYLFKESEIGGDGRIPVVCFQGFQEYIENAYNLQATTKGVFTIIAENTTNDEEAFHKFFELLEEYLECTHPDLACEFKASL